jgi:hypothetical protein
MSVCSVQRARWSVQIVCTIRLYGVQSCLCVEGFSNPFDYFPPPFFFLFLGRTEEREEPVS